jgi:hypothetical protein
MIAKVFIMCKSQKIYDYMSKTAVLNLSAVCQIMEVLGVEDREDCLNKIIQLYNDLE